METKDALPIVIDDLRNNRFEVSIHAIQRMTERSLQIVDILALIEGGALENPIWNEQHASWNFTGTGFVGELFTIACIYEQNTLIVTVYWD